MATAHIDDQERLALVAYCANWLNERYDISRIPVSPDQVFFYEHSMPDLDLEDTVEGFAPPSLVNALLRSLIAGVLWTLFTGIWADAWGMDILFWTALSIGLLLVFPAVMIFHRRKVVEVQEDDAAPAVAACLGMARFNSCLSRASLHALIDLLLLPALMSYSGAVRLRLEQDYALAHGMLDWEQRKSPLRWRRGLKLVMFLEERFGENGLGMLLRFG